MMMMMAMMMQSRACGRGVVAAASAQCGSRRRAVAEGMMRTRVMVREAAAATAPQMVRLETWRTLSTKAALQTQQQETHQQTQQQQHMPSCFTRRRTTASPSTSCAVDFDQLEAVDAGPLGLFVFPDVISEAEEEHLMSQVNRKLKRMRYASAHFDRAISGYREMRKSRWDPASMDTFARLQTMHPSLQAHIQPNPSYHILDLEAEGTIFPHVDSLKYAGPVIAGISMLSDAVMTFASEKDPSDVIEAFLPRRSMYIMSNRIRYDYTHAVEYKQFIWGGNTYERTRRVSLLMRNED
ncbi:hypothetical protein PTSG_05873 [Salpingoeca rosetta]|uniref:Alpha-ketoglutarate-dependent dioxygenase AlkB-like domain-containing protein n=1 Tax=Salpingoeca rosetta (strain ATCC 50818 / BSB-021) TaxID=946362 RepID=F2UD14_SALR5|nr:uncharacterized protein PTSG_05873 [Salpingoeca rosetta]EGD74509.1 hypothetical protein PTSG_05873 [Salpingoeca rosetta]|eukprot:XP_004992766.1 hypothetical protein PTSG_05873 [Salpingoeca rosetta]